MAVVEEYAVGIGGVVALFWLVILSLDFEIGRLAIGRGEVDVLFGKAFFFLVDSYFFGYLFHSPSDHLD